MASRSFVPFLLIPRCSKSVTLCRTASAVKGVHLQSDKGIPDYHVCTVCCLEHWCTSRCKRQRGRKHIIQLSTILHSQWQDLCHICSAINSAEPVTTSNNRHHVAQASCVLHALRCQSKCNCDTGSARQQERSDRSQFEWQLKLDRMTEWVYK